MTKETLLTLLLASSAMAQPFPPMPKVLAPSGTNLTIAWDASSWWTVDGYRLYWGAASHVYTNMVDAGPELRVTVTNLVKRTTYYFAATSYDALGESFYSSELVYVPPVGPTNRVVTITAETSSNLTNWASFTNMAPIVFTNPPAPAFYRLLIRETLQ